MSIEKTNRFRYRKNLENFGSPCMYPMAYRWMSAPMPVMNSAMAIESWSARNADVDVQPADGQPRGRGRW